jgi:hypothetical protein
MDLGTIAASLQAGAYAAPQRLLRDVRQVLCCCETIMLHNHVMNAMQSDSFQRLLVCFDVAPSHLTAHAPCDREPDASK